MNSSHPTPSRRARRPKSESVTRTKHMASLGHEVEHGTPETVQQTQHTGHSTHASNNISSKTSPQDHGGGSLNGDVFGAVFEAGLNASAIDCKDQNNTSFKPNIIGVLGQQLPQNHNHGKDASMVEKELMMGTKQVVKKEECPHSINGVCEWCAHSSRKEWEDMMSRLGSCNTILDELDCREDGHASANVQQKLSLDDKPLRNSSTAPEIATLYSELHMFNKRLVQKRDRVICRFWFVRKVANVILVWLSNLRHEEQIKVLQNTRMQNAVHQRQIAEDRISLNALLVEANANAQHILADETTKLSIAIVKSESRCSELQSQVTQLKAEVSRNAVSQDHHVAKEARYADLMTRFTESQARNARLDDALAEQQAKYESLLSQSQQQEARAEGEMRRQLASQRAEMNTKLEQRGRDMTDLEQAMKKMHTENNMQTESQRNELSNLYSHVQQLLQLIRTKDGEIAWLKEQNSEHQTEIETQLVAMGALAGEYPTMSMSTGMSRPLRNSGTDTVCRTHKLESALSYKDFCMSEEDAQILEMTRHQQVVRNAL